MITTIDKPLPKNEISEIAMTDARVELFEWFMTHGIQTDDDLHYFIKEFMGFDIPQKSFCKGHNAPFDFIKDVFFDIVRGILVLAARGSGKTLGFAILEYLKTTLRKYYEVTCSASTLDQAAKNTGYLNKFSKDNLLGGELTGNGDFYRSKRDSTIKVITASLQGFNSPHPHLNIIDEVELIKKELLDEAFSMTISTEGFIAQDLLGSTRKKSRGTMDYLLKNAEKFGLNVYKHCIFEIVERCPDQYNCDKCPVLDKCRRRAKDVPGGYFSIEDFIEKGRKLSKEAFDIQWACEKPSLQGAFYKEFDYDSNTMNVVKFCDRYGIARNGETKPWKLIPKEWTKIGCFDWGVADPTTWLAMTISPVDGIIYIFKEHYQNETKPSDNPRIFMGMKKNRLGKIFPWFLINFKRLVADPSGKAYIMEFNENKEFKELNLKFLSAIKDLDLTYSIMKEYISYDEVIESSKFMIFKECENTIEEHIDLFYPIDGGSEYPDDACSNHTCDAARYGVAYFELLRRKRIRQAKQNRTMVICGDEV